MELILFYGTERHLCGSYVFYFIFWRPLVIRLCDDKLTEHIDNVCNVLRMWFVPMISKSSGLIEGKTR